MNFELHLKWPDGVKMPDMSGFNRIAPLLTIDPGCGEPHIVFPNGYRLAQDQTMTPHDVVKFCCAVRDAIRQTRQQREARRASGV